MGSSRRRFSSGGGISGNLGDVEADCGEDAAEEITSSEQCRQAANNLDLIWMGSENNYNYPKGCYKAQVDGQAGDRAWYNSHSSGSSNPGFAYETIVCDQGSGVFGTILSVLLTLGCCCGIPILICAACYRKQLQEKYQTMVGTEDQAGQGTAGQAAQNSVPVGTPAYVQPVPNANQSVPTYVQSVPVGGHHVWVAPQSEQMQANPESVPNANPQSVPLGVPPVAWQANPESVPNANPESVPLGVPPVALK
jgi:hypothetical protein